MKKFKGEIDTGIVRSRIAPSPTGFAHIGSFYNALFNKAWALKNNGQFVWRSEDTDRNRIVVGGEEAIQEGLEWFNLLPDESPFKGGKYGPYRQSERLDVYKKYALELVAKGNAYYCFCSKERLENIKSSAVKDKKLPMYDRHCLNLSKEEIENSLKNGRAFVIRLKVPKDEKVICKDLIRGDIVFDSNIIDDQVLLKSDGYPTYHLAVVIDDRLMKISHVIRGHEWIPSFPKQVILYKMLGFSMPVFAHFPSVLNMEGKGKLSKRHGHSSLSWYRSKGFLEDAILNFIALLGWSHPDSKEIFDFKEFVEKFDIKDISPNLPKFDLVKLEWMNGEYIRNKSNKEVIKLIDEWLTFNLTKHAEDISKFQSEFTVVDYKAFKCIFDAFDAGKKDLFVTINKERIKKLDDLLVLNLFMFRDYKSILTESDLTKEITKYKNIDEIKGHFEWIIQKIEKISEWKLENLKALESEIKDKASILNWKILEVFYPIRIAIARNKISPPLFESIYLLGKEKSLERLRI